MDIKSVHAVSQKVIIKFKEMKYLLIFFLSLSVQLSFSQKKVYLSGVIKNYYNEIEVEDMSEYQSFKISKERIYYFLDSMGKFEITLQINKANYFRIGRNILYLIPGDSIYMELDYRKPENALFKGVNSAANSFLATTPFPKGGSFLSSGDNIKETVELTIDTILNISKKRKELLNNYINISKEFKILENARIEADVLNSISLLYTYYVYEHKIKNDSLGYYANKCKAIKDNFYTKYSSDFLDVAFLKLVVYRNILKDLVHYTLNKEKIPLIISEYIELEKLSEKSNTTTNKDSLQNIKKEVLKFSNSLYKKMLLKKINTFLLFGNGSTAKSFEALRLNGKAIHLSEFRNKIIYIDIWATWCEPCLKQMPAFELLKEKYKSNPDIVFISLSIDDNLEAWKTNVTKRNAKGEQWFINRYKLKDYDVFSIPRAILIDKNFKVVEMKAELPDSKDVETQINSLL
ncbi:MAG: TlpA family protein disulfide reductase [Chitinophagaceae bacterium]|nr:TlpA family protein disulfide reductase [Chitinophagaceae bacterium]